MKTKLILTLVAIIFGSGISMANTNTSVSEKNENNEIRKSFSRVISFPEKLKAPSFNETVNVRFKINSNGKVEILKISTQNDELKKHVLERIAKMNIQPSQSSEEKVYSIELDFKVL